MAKDKEPPAKEEEEELESLTTREKILRVALEVFGEKGLHGATMVEIAKRAGLTGGALYRYFDSKESLFKAVIESHAVAFEALELVRPLVSELEPRTALKFIAQGTLLVFFAEKDFMRMVAAEAVKNPDLAAPFFDEMLNPARNFMEDCIVNWQEKGLLREDVDTKVATIAFLGILGYFAAEEAFFGTGLLAETELTDIVDQFATIILSGILKG